MIVKEKKYFYTLDEYQNDVIKATDEEPKGVEGIWKSLRGIHDELLDAMAVITDDGQVRDMEALICYVGGVMKNCAKFAMAAGVGLGDIAEWSIRE